MNKKQLIVVGAICCYIFFYGVNIYPSSTELDLYLDRQRVTDSELEEIAIKYGIIPKYPPENFAKKEIESRNTISIWVMMKREDKIKLIDGLKDMFKKDGVAIKLPTDYYVDELNAVLFSMIQEGNINESNQKGLGAAFKTIAIMEGDFDSGTDKIELIKKHIGEDLFEQYKEVYCNKYQRMIKE